MFKKKKKQESISLDCPDDYVRRRDVIAYIIGRYNDQLGFLTPKEMVEQIEMIKGMEGFDVQNRRLGMGD